MAPKATSLSALCQADAEELVRKSSVGKALAAIVLPLAGASASGSVDSACACHLVYVRPGGCLIVVPNQPDVIACLTELESEDGTATFEGPIAVESSRGQALGTAEACLVDLPWGVIGSFFSGSTLRSARFKMLRLSNSKSKAELVAQPSPVRKILQILGSIQKWIPQQPKNTTLPKRVRSPRSRVSKFPVTDWCNLTRNRPRRQRATSPCCPCNGASPNWRWS